MVLHNVRKVSMRKILEFRASKIASAGFSGHRYTLSMFKPSKCSENSSHLQYSGSALVAIQPLPSFDRMLTLSCAALI